VSVEEIPKVATVRGGFHPQGKAPFLLITQRKPLWLTWNKVCPIEARYRSRDMDAVGDFFCDSDAGREVPHDGSPDEFDRPSCPDHHGPNMPVTR